MAFLLWYFFTLRQPVIYDNEHDHNNWSLVKLTCFRYLFSFANFSLSFRFYILTKFDGVAVTTRSMPSKAIEDYSLKNNCFEIKKSKSLHRLHVNRVKSTIINDSIDEQLFSCWMNATTASGNRSITTREKESLFHTFGFESNPKWRRTFPPKMRTFFLSFRLSLPSRVEVSSSPFFNYLNCDIDFTRLFFFSKSQNRRWEKNSDENTEK